MCEWVAIRDERAADAVDGGGSALWATGAEDVEAMVPVRVQVTVPLHAFKTQVNNALTRPIDARIVSATMVLFELSGLLQTRITQRVHTI